MDRCRIGIHDVRVDDGVDARSHRSPRRPPRIEANYDEAKVPQYTLPDPLTLSSGEKVADVKTWTERRRPELLHLFETQVFGRPAHATKPKSLRTSIARDALGGLATRKEVTVFLDGTDTGPRMQLLVYIPNGGAAGKKPAFLGFNFGGNHTVHADPGSRCRPSGRVRGARSSTPRRRRPRTRAEAPRRSGRSRPC